jgi:hypothetical protein
MLDASKRVSDVLLHGDADTVRRLACPLSGGALRIGFYESEGFMALHATRREAGFALRLDGIPKRPSWVEELGHDFITQPNAA